MPSNENSSVIIFDDRHYEIIDLKRELGEKQAEIDRLMLEYCPNEMTKEQMDNWESHQVKSDLDI